MTDVTLNASKTRGGTQRATVADVARLAGVSVKTASRALSNGELVKASTRTKVLDAAKALRFRPNAIARDLRSGGVASSVAFVIGDLTNPFYAQVASGVSTATAERGLTLVISASDDQAAREQPTVVSMIERRVQALLLVPIAEDHSYLEGERQFGIPIVAVDRPLTNVASDSVVFDNRGGARAGVLALADAGHRRICFVGSSAHLYTHGERLAGYRDALLIRGLQDDPVLVRQDGESTDTAERAMSELLDLSDPPDAVFAGNNRAALGVYRALRAKGSPVAMLSFDDFELASILGISVVAHDPREMGRMAAQIAFRRLDGLEGHLEQVVLPTELLLRESHRLLSESAG
ncbi:LacI family DNA-binding transcriptional regulator [Marisediminicola senii]|uniref:LacI family DNA-binding transcriptional regulator n=1 Tax=Marisediminicola senii TaxID=2711233 RepID=UPI0013EAF7A5|nr:LacI family DNA-binding transcriptional regulator [Marisediminicola senii]